MKLEISEIVRGTDPEVVMDILETELRSVADDVQRSGTQISAGRMVGASSGHINRTDSIFVLRSSGLQVLLAGQMIYRPSFNYWCWLFVLIFTAFGWVIPILAYLYQMRVAQSAMEQVMRRVMLECELQLSK